MRGNYEWTGREISEYGVRINMWIVQRHKDKMKEGKVDAINSEFLFFFLMMRVPIDLRHFKHTSRTH